MTYNYYFGKQQTLSTHFEDNRASSKCNFVLKDIKLRGNATNRFAKNIYQFNSLKFNYCRGILHKAPSYYISIPQNFGNCRVENTQIAIFNGCPNVPHKLLSRANQKRIKVHRMQSEYISHGNKTERGPSTESYVAKPSFSYRAHKNNILMEICTSVP